MDLIGYLHVARRRWLLLVGGAMIAVVVVWVTLPAAGKAASTTTSYRATTTMIATPSNEASLGLPTIALFATVGEVPQRVATRLGFDQDPQVLASLVTTAVDPTTSTLTISSTDTNGPAAARRVNAFADELVAHFESRARERTEAELEALNLSLARYATRMERLDREIADRSDDSTLLAEREGVQGYYQALVAEAASLQDDLTGTTPVEVLQPAVPVPAGTETIAPPSDPKQRLLIGAGLGLALGFALALIIERLDSRLRSREEVETALNLPVLAEIPARPWLQRRQVSILSATEPGGATAEAYRSLRSTMLLLQPDPRNAGEPVSQPRSTPAVILVTSPRPGEGKTSTVANLAVVMAESGRRVLVLSLDFRNPRIHDYLGTPNGAGLSDLLSAGRPQDIEGVLRDTTYPGVQLATSGQETSHPGALLTSAGDLISGARELADVVLIDTAPMLAVSDAVDLSPHVDAVLVVARANRTTAGQAVAARRLLTRLGVPALGAVLVGGPNPGSRGVYPSRLSLAQQLAERLGVKAGPAKDERDGHDDGVHAVPTPRGRDDG
jgi:capsular exopolysaccharide synthesis family protein